MGIVVKFYPRFPTLKSFGKKADLRTKGRRQMENDLTRVSVNCSVTVFIFQVFRGIAGKIKGAQCVLLILNLAYMKTPCQDFFPESKEIWWLATHLKSPVAVSIEEQFRDAKGARFGVKLKWTQFEKGEYLERMYLLVDMAMLVWTSVGRFVERTKPKVRMRCRKKGARLSLVRIGILFFSQVKKTLRLTTKFVKANLPRPKVRLFNWLRIKQK
jgi:hypothetical protein